MTVAPQSVSARCGRSARHRRRRNLQRREFLKNTAAIAGAAAVGGRAPSSMATTPKDTLLVLVENGPNSLDIHGVGTTFRSYVACWNLYDRLLTFAPKTLPHGGLSYDYTKIEPEPAEARAVRRPRRPHDPHRLSAQGQAHPARSRGGGAGGVQFEARPQPRQR